MAESEFREIKFTDADVVNLDDWIPAGEYNPHNVRPFLFHDHGFVLCVVFADCESNALDEAADSGKLDSFKIDLESESEFEDYLTPNWSEADSGLDRDCPEITKNGVAYWWRQYKIPSFLGNAGEPFDIDSLNMELMPNPRRSFCAQFNEPR